MEHYKIVGSPSVSVAYTMTLPNVSGILEGNDPKIEFRLNFNLVSRLIMTLFAGVNSMLPTTFENESNENIHIQVLMPPYFCKQSVRIGNSVILGYWNL